MAQNLFRTVLVALGIFLFGECAPALAQRYEYQLLSPITSDNEEAVAAASAHWILLNDLNTVPPCPVAYHLEKRVAYRLCDVGLVRAFAINREGATVGYTHTRGRHRAAVWDPVSGLRNLPFLNRGDIFSEALDINDAGHVVGVSATPKTLSGTVTDYDGKVTSVTKHVLEPAAFRWSAKDGVRRLFPKGGAFHSAAVKINSHGRIVIFRSSNQVQLNDGYLEFGSYSMCVRVPGGGSYCLRDNQGPFDASCLENNLNCLHVRQLAIGERGQLVYYKDVYAPSKRRLTRSLGNRYYCDRCDYPYEAAIAPSGIIADHTSTTPILELAAGAEVSATCLAPQNRLITNSQLRVGSIQTALTFAGFNRDNSLFFSSDLVGDGRKSQLLMLVPLARTEWGTHIDFCPDLAGSTDDSSANSTAVTFSLRSPIDKYPQEEVSFSKLSYYYDDKNKYTQCQPEIAGTGSTGIDGTGHISLPRLSDYFDLYMFPASPKFSGFVQIRSAAVERKQCA